MLFGGRTSLTERADTWEWDGTTWTQVPTVVAPPARTGLSMAPDVTGSLAFIGGNATFESRSATWRLQSEQITEPRERCTADVDDDGDELTGCEDPDCWTRCAPLCQPGGTCAGQRCDDDACDAPLETYASCPADCP